MWYWIGDNTRIPRVGSLKAYKLYYNTMIRGAIHSKTHGQCPMGLTSQLLNHLHKRVEIIDCQGETRLFWVGKSTGWMPCHLEIPKINSTGGMAVYNDPFKSVRVVNHMMRR